MAARTKGLSPQVMVGLAGMSPLRSLGLNILSLSFSILLLCLRLGAGPRLASAVGNDDQGRGLTSDQRLDTSLVRRKQFL